MTRPDEARVPALDGFRGLAILLVVLFHFVPAPLRDHGRLLFFATALLRTGWVGVDLLFVLTGYLVTRRLLAGQRAGEFLVRRARRILPLYGIVLGLELLGSLLPWHGPYAALFCWTAPVAPYLFLVQDISIAFSDPLGPVTMGTWAIALEAQAYLALAAIAALRARHDRLRNIALVGLVLLPLARCVLGGEAAFVLRADGLLIGILLATRPVPAWSLRVPLTLGWGVVLFALARSEANRLFPVFLASVALRGLGYSALALLAGLSLLRVLESPPRWLTSFPLTSLGKRSYGIYLFHQGVNGWLHAALLHAAPGLTDAASALVTFAAFLISVLLADLAWNLLEKGRVKPERPPGNPLERGEPLVVA